MNQKQSRFQVLALTRIIYEEMAGCTTEEPFRPLAFEQAKELDLETFRRARKAAERIIATLSK